jgi:U3 small nucleolar ribonucleoprotein component
MIFDERLRRSRRVKGAYERQLKGLLTRFFSEAHNESKKKINSLYDQYNGEWLRISGKANASSKEIVLHSDEFELCTKYAFRVVFLSENDAAKESSLRTIKILEGRSPLVYFIRSIVYSFQRSKN